MVVDSKTLDDKVAKGVEAFAGFTKRDNQIHLAEYVVGRGIDKFYDAISGHIDGEFGKDEKGEKLATEKISAKKLSAKHKDSISEGFTKAMYQYIEHAEKGHALGNALHKKDGKVDMKNKFNQEQVLRHFAEYHAGSEVAGKIKNIIDSLDTEEMTVGEFYQQLRAIKAAAPNEFMKTAVNRAYTLHLGGVDRKRVTQHILGKDEIKNSYDITNPIQFIHSDPGAAIGALNFARYRDTGFDATEYGLKLKEHKAQEKKKAA